MRYITNRVVLVVAVIAIGTMGIVAQAPSKPSFEVASVKATNRRGGMIKEPGDRFTAVGQSLRILIGYAYRLRVLQVIGGPSWMDTDLWEIQAKAEDSTATDTLPAADDTKPDAIALMLQSLLEERFQLKLHHEMRDFPGYLLTVGKSGAKLKSSEDQSDPRLQPLQNIPIGQRRGIIRRTDDGWIANAVRMSTLANLVSQPLGRPVLDKTGLEGIYDFKLNWVYPKRGAPAATDAATPSASDPADGSIFTAIDELGLKLESAKVPFEVLVIDNVERPSEN